MTPAPSLAADLIAKSLFLDYLSWYMKRKKYEFYFLAGVSF